MNARIATCRRALAIAAISMFALCAMPHQALAQAGSQDAAASDKSADEMVVTAQRRSQSLSDVSVSVSAVDGSTLARTNTAGLESLQNLVPSVSFGNDFNFAKLFIRGIGLSSSLPGVDPSVAFHVDGVVVSLAQAQLGSMFDLQRVEVLRGPQGTLYGRNATGGAVNLITARPTDTLDGYVRFTVGGDDLNLIGEAAVGGPIASNVRARLAVRAVRRNGFGVNETTGNQIDNARQLSARAQVELLPTETLSVLFTGEYHREDDRGLHIKFREVSFPGVLNDAIAANDGLSALGQRRNADGSQARFSANPRNVATNFDPINDRKQWALTTAVAWTASDDVTLKSLTSWRSFDAIFFQDFDMSTYLGFPLAQTNALQSSANHWQPAFQDQFTQELQVNVDAGPFNGVFGVFYLNEAINVENHIGLDVLTNTDPFRVQFDGRMDVQAAAAFANIIYALGDKVALKAGARYSWEERRLRSNTGLGSAALNRLVLDPLQWDVSRSWNDFSPSLGIEYRPNDDLMIYGNWSRGFKSGTAEIGSTRRLSATQGLPFVDPETVNAVEVGSKYSAGRVSANVALFLQRLNNGQFSLTRPIPGPPFFSSTLTNAAKSEAYGVDVDLLWRVSGAFRVQAALGYLHSRFTQFSAADPLDPRLFAPGAVESQLVKDLSGNATRMSPTWSVNLTPTYEIALPSGGSIELGGSLAYRSRQFHTEFNDIRLSQAGYVMLDSNVQYTAPNGKFTANLWVKNLTDELVYAGSFSIATSRAIGGTQMPPRQYGVTLGFSF